MALRLVLLCCLFCCQFIVGQIGSRALLKADKFYIKKQYGEAGPIYAKYLEAHPREYYASRQAALCFDYLNDHYAAADYWAAVVESSEVTEQDYMSFARCLLANDREPEARKIIVFLSASKDPFIAEWVKAYRARDQFYSDSAFCRIRYLEQLNSDNSESCPLAFSGKFLFVSSAGPGNRMFRPSPQPPTQRVQTYGLQDSLVFTKNDLLSKLEYYNLCGQVTVSGDGGSFFFCKPIGGDQLKSSSRTPFSRYQLFILNLLTLNNNVPEVKPFFYNSVQYNILHPSLSADGSRLYFSSDMKGGAGGYDIYCCKWENNDWSQPQALGPEVNTPGNELFPYISDQGALYFSSDYRPGVGGLDIFVSEPSEEGNFLQAKNCGAPFNSRHDDFGICFLKGFRKGYFTSNRRTGSDDDLYFFSQSE